MKKIVVVVSAVLGLLVVLGVGFFIVNKSHPQALRVEDLLPASPVFYVKENRVAERLENFGKTKFWQELTAIDYQKFTQEMGIAQPQVDEANKILKDIFSPENMTIAKSLFGRETALAIYLGNFVSPTDVKSPEDIQKFVIASLENIVIVSRVGTEVQVADRLSKISGKINKDLNLTQTDYNGRTIHTFTSPDGSFKMSYVLIQDLLVLGINEKAARQAIDTFKNKTTALSADPEFKKYQQTFMTDPDSYGFLNLKLVYQFIKEQVLQFAKASGQTNKMLEEQFENQFKQTDGFLSMTYSSQTTDVMKSQMQLHYNLAEMQPNVRDFYDGKPQNNTTAKFVPWDAIYYQWNAGMHFDRLWSEMKRGMNEQAKASGGRVSSDQMIKMYEQMLGMSIESDILPALGHEIGGFVTNVNTAGNFPIPQMVLFVETTGRDKMNALLDRLINLQPMLKPQEENFQGETIKSIPIPFVPNVQIAYSYINNYFLLSSSVDTLKASITAQKNQDKSILANPVYLSSCGGADSKMNSVVYIQFDTLTKKANEVIDWALRMQKQEAQQRNAFLAGSKKNLEKIKTDKVNLEAQYKDLQGQLTAAQAQVLPVDAAVDQTTMVEGLKKKTEDNRKEFAALEEKEKELSRTIESFSQKRAESIESYEGLVNNLLKPMMKAFGNIKYIFTKVVNDNQTSESLIYSKVE